jgi:hypothetical protein
MNNNNTHKNALATIEGKKTITTWIEGNESLIG